MTAITVPQNVVGRPAFSPSRMHRGGRWIWVHAGITSVAVAYLIITLAYARLIGAWEANDEMHHVANTEYILQQRQLYPLRLESWHETHQPPLYYALAALWQRALRIPAFHSEDPEPTRPVVDDNPQLVYTHRYDKPQRAAAIAVHKLRFLSVGLGLATVLLTYAAARFIAGERAKAVAAAAFVAFLPKFNIVMASFTNDALVIPLCSLALVLTLAYRNASARTRIALAAALGLVAGAAAITKLNSLPVVAVFFTALALVSHENLTARLRNLTIGAFGFALVAGWWFARNYRTFGEWLGRTSAEAWLNHVLPGNISVVAWTDAERFLNFVPTRLVQSFWYQGGWNQFFAPFGLNFALAVLAAIALFSLARVCLTERTAGEVDYRNLGLLTCTTVAAFAAVFIIAKTATQAEGRIAYVGLSAFAILCTLGTCEALGSCGRWRSFAVAFWPVTLLLFNTYVFVRFIWPYRAY